MWNFNHKSQKRPVQLNSTLLHKELIKVATRRWTRAVLYWKRGHMSLPRDVLQRENAERLLGIYWNCSAPSQQLMESTTNHYDHTDQQFRQIWSQRLQCHHVALLKGFLPPTFLLSAGKRGRAGELEMDTRLPGLGQLEPLKVDLPQRSTSPKAVEVLRQEVSMFRR